MITYAPTPNYYEDYICHYNHNHDPKTGQFTKSMYKQIKKDKKVFKAEAKAKRIRGGRNKRAYVGKQLVEKYGQTNMTKFVQANYLERRIKEKVIGSGIIAGAGLLTVSALAVASHRIKKNRNGIPSTFVRARYNKRLGKWV